MAIEKSNSFSENVSSSPELFAKHLFNILNEFQTQPPVNAPKGSGDKVRTESPARSDVYKDAMDASPEIDAKSDVKSEISEKKASGIPLRKSGNTTARSVRHFEKFDSRCYPCFEISKGWGDACEKAFHADEEAVITHFSFQIRFQFCR